MAESDRSKPDQSDGGAPEEGSLPDALEIEVHYAPEALAPPIDEGRLQALIERRLSGEERHEVLTLMATFRSWHDAWAVLRRKHFENDA